jgi:hypothetical protein
MSLVTYLPMASGKRLELNGVDLEAVERGVAGHLPRVRARTPEANAVVGGPFISIVGQGESPIANLSIVISATETQWLRQHIGNIDQLIVEDHGEPTS